MRKYGFQADEIPFESDGNLSLVYDPKEHWARLHPKFFPVDINKADTFELLRIPGIGFVTAKRILDYRKKGYKIKSSYDLGLIRGKRIEKLKKYIVF
jgi:predicted DNA-binding helix-hairpin-helix protein